MVTRLVTLTRRGGGFRRSSPGVPAAAGDPMLGVLVPAKAPESEVAAVDRWAEVPLLFGQRSIECHIPRRNDYAFLQSDRMTNMLSRPVEQESPPSSPSIQLGHFASVAFRIVGRSDHRVWRPNGIHGSSAQSTSSGHSKATPTNQSAMRLFSRVKR